MLSASATASSSLVAGRRTSLTSSARKLPHMTDTSGEFEEDVFQFAFAHPQFADRDAGGDQFGVDRRRPVGLDGEVEAAVADGHPLGAQQRADVCGGPVE